MPYQQNSTPDISVCVSTYRRANRLARLLESVRQLSPSDAFTLEIVIVDNDAAESARPIVEAVQHDFPYPVHYDIEPQQNISHARNRSVQNARGTWVAFIDDDEIVDPDWLVTYWRMLADYPGDGYFGSVLIELEQPAPTWLDVDLLLDHLHFHYPTGTPMPPKLTRTTNALIRRSLFDANQFDPCFKFPGGEDSELFIRMIDAGAQFYWCDEAVTYECYPPERICLRWLVQRYFRGGFLYTRVDRMRRPWFTRQVFSLVKAMGGLGVFTLMLPFDLIRGWSFAVKRFLRISMQAGHLWEFCQLTSIFQNMTYEEYRTPHAKKSNSQ